MRPSSTRIIVAAAVIGLVIDEMRKIAADRDVARGVGLLQRLDRGLEVGGSPELLCELSAQTGSRPDLVDQPSPGFRIGPPAQPELDELRLALAACALVAADELAIG